MVAATAYHRSQLLITTSEDVDDGFIWVGSYTSPWEKGNSFRIRLHVISEVQDGVVDRRLQLKQLIDLVMVPL